MDLQQYCLRWKHHHSNLQAMFCELLERSVFCDVTLACEGRTIRAHRVVLCACSTYFATLLTGCSAQKDPIIIMRDARYDDVRCLVEFMYRGEINVDYRRLGSLLKTAEDLCIKGLAEVACSAIYLGHHAQSVEPAGEGPNDRYNSSVSGGEGVSFREKSLSEGPDDPDTVESALSTSPLLAPTAPLQLPGSVVTNGTKKRRGRPPLDDEWPSAHHQPYVHTSNTTRSLESRARPPASLRSPLDITYPLLTNALERPCQTSPKQDTAPPAWNEPVPPPKPKLEPHHHWKDVVKMKDYLARGRRPQFWEEPFTKRVLRGIRNRTLEMKRAAKLLGVSYGTLYGRYRETYGCLKHQLRRSLARPRGSIEDLGDTNFRANLPPSMFGGELDTAGHPLAHSDIFRAGQPPPIPTLPHPASSPIFPPSDSNITPKWLPINATNQ
uniref:BTB domain-containing protein n=1 Tax=Anopheles dirus TaxID=7168 RepID=A0A182N1L2_9DIPT